MTVHCADLVFGHIGDNAWGFAIDQDIGIEPHYLAVVPEFGLFWHQAFLPGR